MVVYNQDYLSQDSTLILPNQALDREYIVAGIWPDGVKSQLAVTSDNDTLIDIVLPKKGNAA